MTPAPSLLVIEDDEPLRTMISVVLREAGFTVTVARDGREGLRLFHENPTEIVITDIVMPDTEGIDVITALARDYPVVGLIAMSGHTAHSSLYLSMAKRLGAHRILPKPFTVPELLNAVNATWESISRAGDHGSGRTDPAQPRSGDS